MARSHCHHRSLGDFDRLGRPRPTEREVAHIASGFRIANQRIVNSKQPRPSDPTRYSLLAIRPSHFASWKMIAERVAAAGAQPAHAVAQVDAVDAARALHRPVVHREDHARRPGASGTTSARDCMRGRCSVSTNSPPVKSLPGLRQQDRDLQREDVLAVEILVQAVVVARAVPQQQRRRPRLARPAWQRARNAACSRGIAHVDAQRLVPAVGDRGERRIERRAQRRDRARAADRRSTCTRRARSRAAP